MNQYQIVNASSLIDGYFDPRPSDVTSRQRKAFDRAQAECIKHLADQLNAVSTLSIDQFMTVTKRAKLFAAELGASTGAST